MIYYLIIIPGFENYTQALFLEENLLVDAFPAVHNAQFTHRTLSEIENFV